MAVNKVEFGGETLMDLTEDTVTPETLAEGVTAHDASGEKIVGTLNLSPYQTKVDENLKTADKSIVGAINELNSMVNGSDSTLIGAQTFKNTISLTHSVDTVYSVKFNCNGTEYEFFRVSVVGPDFWNSWGLYACNGEDGATQTLFYLVDNSGGSLGMTPGWQDTLQKNIEILEEPDDTETINWLNTNLMGRDNSGSVDSELSDTSTNPVQNKAVTAAIDNLDHLIRNEITDLTDTTWYIKKGCTVNAGYGIFSINGTLTLGGYGFKNKEFYKFCVGYDYRTGTAKDDMLYFEGDTLFGTTNEQDYLELKITGGIDATNPALIAWVCQASGVPIKEEPNTNSKTVFGAINELNNKIDDIAETVGMPQIRFVGMPCDGLFGTVDFTEITGESYLEDRDIKFTVEIVGGGPLQVGDAIQLCGMKLFGLSVDKNGKYHPQKRKLRRVAEHQITEDDLNKRFITMTVDWNNEQAMRLFTKTEFNNGGCKSPMYFRIRRSKGNINQNTGMTVDAEFSNVVTVWKSYTYYTGYDEETENEWTFCKLRLV